MAEDDFTYALGRGDTFTPFTGAPVSYNVPALPRGQGGADPMSAVMRQLSSFVSQEQKAQQRGTRSELPSLDMVAMAEGWTPENAQEKYDSFTRRLALEAAGNKLTNIDTIQNSARTRYDPDFEAWLAAHGGTPTAQPQQGGSSAGDFLRAAVRGGLQQLGEFGVGVGQLATGARLSGPSQWLEEKRQQYEQSLTPETQRQRAEARAAISDERGFFETIETLYDNPRAIATLSVENLAGSLGPGAFVRMSERAIANAALREGVTGAAARAIAPAARTLGGTPLRATATGEGLFAGGQAGYERAKDGELSLKDYLATAGIAASTGLLGLLGGRLAQKLGLENIEAVLIPGGSTIARRPGITGAATNIVGSAGLEGLEEVAQESVEQMIDNIAEGAPLTKGVASRAAMGGTLGFAMGGSVSGVSNTLSGIRGGRQGEISSTPLPEVTEPLATPTVQQAIEEQLPAQVVEEAVAATEETPQADAERELSQVIFELAAMPDAATRETAIQEIATSMSPNPEAAAAEVNALRLLVAEARQDMAAQTTSEAESIRQQAMEELGIPSTEESVDGTQIFGEEPAVQQQTINAPALQQDVQAIQDTQQTPIEGTAEEGPIVSNETIEPIAQAGPIVSNETIEPIAQAGPVVEMQEPVVGAQEPTTEVQEPTTIASEAEPIAAAQEPAAAVEMPIASPQAQSIADFIGKTDAPPVDAALEALNFIDEYGTLKQSAAAEQIKSIYERTGSYEILERRTAQLIKQFASNENIARQANRKRYLDVVGNLEANGTIDTDLAAKLRNVAKSLPHLFNNVTLDAEGNRQARIQSSAALVNTLLDTNNIIVDPNAAPSEVVQRLLTPMLLALSPEHKIALYREYADSFNKLNKTNLSETEQAAASEISNAINNPDIGMEANIREALQNVPINSPLWQYASPEAYLLTNTPTYISTKPTFIEQLKQLGKTLLNIFRGPNRTRHEAIQAVLTDLFTMPYQRKSGKYKGIRNTAVNTKILGSPTKQINTLRLAGVITENQEKHLLWLADKYPNLMGNIMYGLAPAASFKQGILAEIINDRKVNINSGYTLLNNLYGQDNSDAILHEIFHVAHRYVSPEVNQKILNIYNQARENVIDNEGKGDRTKGQELVDKAIRDKYYGLTNPREFVAEFGSAMLEGNLAASEGLAPSPTGNHASNFVRDWALSPEAVRGFNDLEILQSAEDNLSQSTVPPTAASDYYRSRNITRDSIVEDYRWAQQESPEFISWFGDYTNPNAPHSAVVDMNGMPEIVYHAGIDPEMATLRGGTHFGTEKAGQDRTIDKVYETLMSQVQYHELPSGQYTWDVEPNDNVPYYLETDGAVYTTREAARDAAEAAAQELSHDIIADNESGIVNHAYYLNIRNPKNVPDQGSNWNAAIEQAKTEGYDGLVYTNEYENPGSDSWVAFYPEQIKSAEINTGEFGPGPNQLANIQRQPNQGSAMSQVQTALEQPITDSEALPTYSDWSGLQQFAQRISTSLSDAYTPVRRWLERLPVPDALKQQAIDNLYLGQNLASSMRADINENHGGREIAKRVNQVAQQLNITPEQTQKLIGIWLTANWSTTANQRIEAQLIKAADLKDFESRINKITSGSGTTVNKIIRTEAEFKSYNNAVKALQNFETAINAPANVNRHAAPLAGGYNNAQVQQIKSLIESQIPAAYIRHVAEPVWQMNTERLLHDIEGKRVLVPQLQAFVPPAKAAKVAQLVPKLTDLAKNASSFDAKAMQELNDVRDQMRNLLKSEYVPFYGTLDDSTTSPSGRKSISAPTLKLLEGSTYRVPDDGITTSYQGLEAAVKHARWEPFTSTLYDIASQLSDEDVNKYGLSKPRKSGDTDIAFPNTIKVQDKNGEQYSVSLKNGTLARLLAEPVPPTWTMPIVNKLSGLTRGMGYMITQLNPGFGPVNMLRDVQERISLIASRDYQNAKGEPINSALLAGRTMANAVTKFGEYARAGFQWGQNQQFVDTPAGNFLKSLNRQGGLTVFSQQFNKDMQQAKGNKLAEFVSAYNNAFNMVPILASYEAMLESGMSEQRAAAETLDLANFNKVGTTGPMLSALYAFSRSAFMGGSNFMRTLYNPTTGQLNKKGLATLAASTLLYAALWSMSADMSDDDEGGNKALQLSDAVTAGNFMVPMGDGFVKIPVAYGLMRLANNMGRSLVQMERGYKDPSAAVASMAVNGLMPAVSPFSAPPTSASDMPLFTLLSSITPTALEPALLTAMNRTPFGNELDKPPLKGYTLSTDPRYRGAEAWQDIAQAFSTLTGHEVSPAAVKQMVDGYLPGMPNEMINAFINNPQREAMGQVTQTPILNRFWIQYDPNRKRMTLEAMTAKDEKLKEKYNKELGAINARYRGIYKLPEAQRRARQMQINAERMKVINKLLIEAGGAS